MASIGLFAFGLNPVSNVPSLFTLAILFLVIPPIVVKEPPSNILLSGWIAMASIRLFAFGSNPVSNVPSLFTLAILFLVIPPIVVKEPPSNILLSGWIAMATIGLFAFGLKVKSKLIIFPYHQLFCLQLA